MKRILALVIALAPSVSLAQSAPLIMKQGRVAQAGASDSISVPGSATITGPVSINTTDLGNQINVVAAGGRNMAFFASPNGTTAPWFVLRDGYTGTRGTTGVAGDGNGPHLVFQSANSSGVFKDSAAINCGLIKATSGSEQTDCDYIGNRNGASEVMMAMDASRPALIPGVDGVYQLGDISLGGNHATNRFNFGYFTGGLCVGCSSAAPTDPFQAIVASNSNAGVVIASPSSSLRLIGSFSGGAYNSIVNAGDTGLISSPGAGIVIAPQNGSGGARWDGNGALTQKGPLNVTGPVNVGTGGAVAGKLLDVYQTTTSGADYSAAYINRTTSHTGGTPGVVNGALLVQDYVGAGVSNYEWGLTSILNNSATGGQNVAIYGQASRQTTTTGPTWAGVLEVRETTPIADPTSGTVGLELDMSSNGTDAFNDRIGIDLIAKRYDPTGAATVTGYGIRLNTADSNAKFATGVGIVANADVGFDTSLATINTAAFRMALGQKFAFDANNTLNSDSGGISYKYAGGGLVRLNNNGTVQISVLAVASLGACTPGAEGTISAVRDATSTTFNAALAGGGSNHVLAYCNGSGWTVH